MRAHHRPIVPRYAAVLCCTWLHVFPSLFSVDPVVLPRDNGFGLFCHACHGFCLLTCRRNSALIFPPFSPLAQLLPTRKQAEMEQPNDMEQYYMPSYAYQVIPMPPPVCPHNSFIIFFFFALFALFALPLPLFSCRSPNRRAGSTSTTPGGCSTSTTFPASGSTTALTSSRASPLSNKTSGSRQTTPSTAWSRAKS